MVAKIKHVAIVSENYALLGRFYEALFGMSDSDKGRPEAAVSITDGYIGMNVNPRSAGRQAGFDHFGFEVEDVEEVFARARDKYPEVKWLKRPGNRPFAGISMHDPDGNVFDLSQEGMENRTDVYVDVAHSERAHPRHITHFVLRSLNPSRVGTFYRDVLGLQEASKDASDPNCYLTDGRVTLVVSQWDITNFAGSGIERPTPDHLGFEVEDLEQFKSDLQRLVGRNPYLTPRPLKGKEGEVRQELFATCRYGQFQLCDPDGVLLDVSEAR